MSHVATFMLQRAIMWWLISAIFSLKAYGEVPSVPYGSRVWQTDEGLPHNVIHALVQDRAGYLWVGTQNGLARFDGVRFVTYNSLNAPALRNPHIYAMAEAPDGLWIGTMEDGVVRLSTGKFTTFTAAEGLACNAVRSMLVGRDGSVWIGTTNGISVFNGKTFQTIRGEGAANVVRALCEDADGSILAGTGAGVLRIRNGVSSVAYLGLPGPAVRSLRVDKRSDVWVGYAGGIVRIHKQQLDESMSAGLPDNMVNCVIEDRRSQIWAATSGGLSRMTGTNWVVQKTTEGLVFDGANCLLEDREGNVWAGTKEGLVRFHPQLFARISVQQGLAHNKTTAVLQDRAGTIWTGTWGGGLHRISSNGISIFNAGNGLSRDQVLALHQDSAGGLWAGTDFDGGLNYFRNGTNRIYDSNAGLIDPAVRVLHEDRAGKLWIGTASALVCFKEGKFHRFTKADGLAGNEIRDILEDKHGVLWIGTRDGLSWIRDEIITSASNNHPLGVGSIVALLQGSEDNLWVSIAGGGIVRVRTSGGLAHNETLPLRAYTTREGLPSNDIHEMVEDGLGFLWMTSPRGVFRVHQDRFDEVDAGQSRMLQCQLFDARDGLPSIDCSSVAKPAAWKAQDGRLWFATAKGLTVVGPKIEPQLNNVVPGIVIEEVMADKRLFQVWDAAEVKILPGRGDLEIRYAGLSLSQPEKNKFRYRLEGFDDDWVNAENQRIAYYTHVPPGQYTFQVRACNDDGLWNETGAKVVLTLQPHLWQTTIFRVGMIFGLVGAIGFGVRSISVRKLRNEMRQVQEQNALANERSRIARDMHDDLGARLTEIMFLTDLVQRSDDAGPKTRSHANKLGNASRELVQNLDAIVWAVDPGNDTLDQLALYLHDYVDRYLSMAGIQPSFEIPCSLPRCVISSQARHNLFMAVKEALNNAVKYADCTEIHFSILMERGNLSINIRDNGKGFDLHSAMSLGNGLQNMTRRLEAIGGRFEIRSEVGKGSHVELRFPFR